MTKCISSGNNKPAPFKNAPVLYYTCQTWSAWKFNMA